MRIGLLDDLLTIIGLFSFFVFLPAQWLWKRRQVRKTFLWPLTEATIETGHFEFFSQGKWTSKRLSVFAFSYKVAGAYYSGKFALLPYITDPGESIITRMIGRKLQVRYDPEHPDKWYLTDKLIEGCKVEQKMDPHFLNVVPAE